MRGSAGKKTTTDGAPGWLMRAHYNRASRETSAARRKSAQLDLRKFHNALKRALFARALDLQGRARPGTVLDLACGRGGDVSKWAELGASSYAGVDIAEEALRVAQQRYAHLRGALPQQYARGDMARWRAAAPCAVVSCQFAMHYQGQSLAQLARFWAGVAAQLAPGGVAICTYTDAMAVTRWILAELSRQGHTAGDLLLAKPPLLEITVPPATWGALQQAAACDAPSPPRNLLCHWRMGELVACAEPLVWPQDVACAVQRARLRVRESQNFHDFAYAARVPTHGLTEDEWACSRLYRTLIVEHDA